MSGNLHTGDSLIGITVDHGRYEIVKLIGEGGMGRVFQARQVSMNRMVALKLLRAQLATDDHLLARFQQEAHAVSKLRHPNTIIVYDYGKTEDGYLFIAMELLGGKSLASILSAEQRLMQFRALHIMEQVAGAVAEAHQFGIVHRDLKPENIQIDKVANDPDFAKVLDFGIAKMIHGEGEGGEHRKTLTMAGAVFGTPHYMSPEQVHGQKVDHRTDIYALGIILYELLTGKPIFEGATPMAVMMAQASKPPPDIRQSHPELDVIDTVADLIDDCLVKDADKRLGSANEYIDRVKHAMFQLNQDITGSASGRLLIDPSLLGEERRAARARAAQPQNMAVAETVVPVNEASTAPLGHPVAGKPTASAPGSMRASAPETDDEPVALPKRRTGLFVGLGAAAVAAAGVAIALRPGPPAARAATAGPHVRYGRRSGRPEDSPRNRVDARARHRHAGRRGHRQDAAAGPAQTARGRETDALARRLSGQNRRPRGHRAQRAESGHRPGAGRSRTAERRGHADRLVQHHEHPAGCRDLGGRQTDRQDALRVETAGRRGAGRTSHWQARVQTRRPHGETHRRRCSRRGGQGRPRRCARRCPGPRPGPRDPRPRPRAGHPRTCARVRRRAGHQAEGPRIKGPGADVREALTGRLVLRRAAPTRGALGLAAGWPCRRSDERRRR
jgi:serine/threonine protein kinase